MTADLFRRVEISVSGFFPSYKNWIEFFELNSNNYISFFMTLFDIMKSFSCVFNWKASVNNRF